MLCLISVLAINVVFSYSWQSLPSPGIRAHDHTVVYDPVNDKYFIIGGGDSTGGYTNMMDICLEFDPKTNTWDTKQPMLTRRGEHGASYRKGFIHVFCGRHAYYSSTKRHEVYDIENDSWDTATSAPVTRIFPGVVTWKDSLIYLIGGSSSNSVFFYDAITNSWDTATSMPVTFENGGVKIKDDSIFIIGGRGEIQSYSRILIGEINPADPSEINWSWGDSLPLEGNCLNGLAIKNNKAYMIGGRFGGEGHNQVWEYDILTETWTSFSEYPTNKISRGQFAERRDSPDSSGIVYCFMGDTSSSSIPSRKKPTDECYRLTITTNDAGMYSINSPVSDSIGSFVQVNGTVKNYGINTYSFKTYVKIYDPDLLTAFSDSIQVNDLPPLDTLNINFENFQLTKGGTYTVEMFTYATDDSYSPNDSLITTFNSLDYIDAGMVKINTPVSDTIGSVVKINGTVKNYGPIACSFKTYVNIYDPDFLTAFADSSQVDNLPSLDTLNIDFGSFQLTKGGTHTVEMFTYASDDTNPSNDSLTVSLTCFNYYWEPLSSPGIKASEHSVVYDPVNDLFFIIGGDSTYDYGYPGYMDICLEFDPKTNTWVTKKPMPTKRERHNATYRKGFIHVLCGEDQPDHWISSHEVYNINSDSWDTAAPAPRVCSRPGVLTWRDSLIYLIASSSVYLYDATINSWNTATSLPRSLKEGAAKIKGDSIFIIGGVYNQNILLGEINPADPSEINWSWGESLPSLSYWGIKDNGLAIKNNKAYMIGGDWYSGKNKVWEYDIKKEIWTKFPDYPTPAIYDGNFAERRDSSDDSPVYCFMGKGDSTEDPYEYWTIGPTDKCYRLVELTLTIVDDEEIPTRNSFSINSTIYFTSEIIVNYNIAEICDLKINMYDALGRRVFSHSEKSVPTGRHQFTINKDFKNGIYFIRMEAGTTVENAKVILIR
jgi:N-acetylneuraminic acid mutarotase